MPFFDWRVKSSSILCVIFAYLCHNVIIIIRQILIFILWYWFPPYCPDTTHKCIMGWRQVDCYVLWLDFVPCRESYQTTNLHLSAQTLYRCSYYYYDHILFVFLVHMDFCSNVLKHLLSLCFLIYIWLKSDALLSRSVYLAATVKNHVSITNISKKVKI